MAESRLNPLTLEVIRSAIPAICDEMAVVLRRTAYNMFIYEIQDFSVAIVDPEGNLIGQNRGAIPLFLADLGPPIRSGLEEIGRENFHPGDVVLMNHPAICGQHLNNVIVYQPIFHKEDLVGFGVARGHWLDIGGSKVGLGISKTVDIWQEGLQFRNLKIYDAGVLNQTLHQMIQDNLRRPDLAMGDLRAAMTALRLGEQRYLALLERYGLDTVLEAVSAIADQSDVRVRQALAKLPEGEYFAESFLDDDGFNVGQPVPIKVRVEIKNAQMTIDFTGSSPVVQGPINSGMGGFAIARVAIKLLSAPREPANEGHFRALNLIIPDGTFMSAKPPAPMAMWSMGLSSVMDTILKALAPAMPERIPAGHKADQGEMGFYGIDPATGKYWLAGNARGGGHGGRPHEDGESASMNIVQGEVTTAPVEMMEQLYPLFIERHALIPDSGGAGKFRGGLGDEWVVHPYEVDFITCNVSSERYNCPPWGLWGGKPGVGNHLLLDMADGKGPELVHKRPGVRLPKGGWVAFRSGGGGGWGNPLERDPERVLLDVIRGYISPDKAPNEYGVVLTADGHHVDQSATERLRSEMHSSAQ